MNKDELRKLLIKKRKDILNKKELSTIIVNKLMNLDIYKKAKVIALYNSLKDEVDTSYLITESLKEKIILLPKIFDDNMEYIKINNNTKYNKSHFGVLEPVGSIYQDKIDLIIVPGVAFDKKFNRLGFGMGYYDKYLKKHNVYKIGLCFNEQMVDILPHNELDIPMDMIITPNKIYKKKTL